MRVIPFCRGENVYRVHQQIVEKLCNIFSEISLFLLVQSGSHCTAQLPVEFSENNLQNQPLTL